MALEPYRRKRNFRITPEPAGKRIRASPGRRSFVIQKHDASRLHYDFRLELDGVLLSWAVPKGPSLNPADKRLAIHVEDHPLAYADFEGIIPPQQYGAGTVLVWDRGTWVPLDDARSAYRRGSLKFELHGEKLHGRWALVRTRNARYAADKAWLLIKENDRYARRNGTIVATKPRSVISGRNLAEVAKSPQRVWHSNKSVAENRKSRAKRSAQDKAVPVAPGAGARRALPRFVSPELATLVKAIPGGDGWLHEMKYDGYRMLCRVKGGKVDLYSRNRNRWTAKFPDIARSLGELPLESAWIDGEIVFVDAQGRTSFQRLQNVLSLQDTGALQYYAFDLPYLNGHDLRHVALLERKKRLEAVLASAPANIHYSAHVPGRGEEFLGAACERGLEGVISKRAESGYIGRRTKDWLKVKCGLRQEMVIGGFTDPGGSRAGFGALLMGVHTRGKLRYAGKVGTGFDTELLRTLRKRLDALETRSPAFFDPPAGSRAKGVHWVKPELVAEVAFTEWTDDGTVRHGVFHGLREDKPAKDVVRERPKEGRATPSAAARKRARNSPSRDDTDTVQGVQLTHPDKVFYAECGLTKRDLAQYYAEIAAAILPHIEGRPLTLLRCPDGWKRACFHQKNAPAHMARTLDRVAIVEQGKRKAYYMAANSSEALVTLVQMGVLELHPWGATAARQDHPDRLILDLDPDERVPWRAMVEAVKSIRTVLDTLGLQAFLKTTGGKGLHIVMPVRPTLQWDAAKRFTKAIAELLVSAHPDRFTATMSKAQRKGKIFVDYLRNAKDATAVAPYSTRAREQAPVATPIAWGELKRDVRFAHFNVGNVRERLRRRKDPWADFFAVDQAVTPAMIERVEAF